MKTFFGSIFIEKEKLQEAGVKYPIKLEYYKIINEDEFINKNNAKYGIKVVKTEYIENNTKTEDKTLKYLSRNSFFIMKTNFFKKLAYYGKLV